AGQLGRRPPELVPEAQALWQRYAWPGNVRELRNAVERLLVLHDGGVVDVDDLPPELRARAGRPAPGTLADPIAPPDRERSAAQGTTPTSRSRSCGPASAPTAA